MTNTVEMTPVQNKLDCSAPECKKKFVSQQNMEKHKEKFHKIVSALSHSLFANNVRTLFRGDSVDGSMLPSTQGGSDGSVNSPKVVTEGTFQCNQCPEEYKSKDDLNIHMTEDHNKAQAAPTSERANSATKSKGADDLEDEEATSEGQDMIELGNMMTVDKIVDSFVDTAFRELNPETECHECALKDEIFNNREEMINKNDCLIVERNATVKGLMEKIKVMTKEKTDILKKAKETESLKKSVFEKNKEIFNMKAVIKTKDDLLKMYKAQSETHRPVIENQNTTDEITVEAEV